MAGRDIDTAKVRHDYLDSYERPDNWDIFGMVRFLCDEVDQLRAELREAHQAGFRLTSLDLEAAYAEIERLREVEEWAQDAPHLPGCSGGYGPGYRCKCGRRDLFG